MKIYIPKKKPIPPVITKKTFAWWPVMTIEGNLVWLETVWKRTNHQVVQGEWCYEDHFEHEYSSFDFRIVD